MARGVAIPQLREQLFAAAERILMRDGPSGLTSRALTGEANVAKGVLHSHFGDLDGFLAEFLRSQFERYLSSIDQLGLTPGEGDVRGNVEKVVAAMLSSTVFAVHGIITVRPSLASRLHEAHATGTAQEHPSLMKVSHILAAYLDGEKQAGRIAQRADPRAIAIAVVGTTQHLLLAGDNTDRHARTVMKRVVDALLAGVVVGPDL